MTATSSAPAAPAPPAPPPPPPPPAPAAPRAPGTTAFRGGVERALRTERLIATPAATRAATIAAGSTETPSAPVLRSGRAAARSALSCFLPPVHACRRPVRSFLRTMPPA
ncbi:hypothetical protein E7744_13500 [Citricoccus sp. SGAir0253]|nr:hypothetical protein E7744_13500 [Citricoccus sp. SGAir0253]